ncbi:MAG: hypothetical protein RLZZ211_1796 [Bacteroidota bacterium]|jgi:hypothetical protein
MKHTIALLLFSLLLLPVVSQAQDLAQKEQVAVQLLTELRASTDDDKTLQLHTAFKKAMSELVRSKDFFDYPLQSLKIADLRSTDESVRLLTWNVELSDLSNTYGGFVLRREEGRDRVLVLELTDALDPYSSKPESIIDQKNWYGAVYYKIIDFSFQGKTQYLLFGYDGGTTMSNFKILDVLSFSGQNAKFGSPVFKDPKGLKKRIVFEYSNMASMSLEFEPKRARIVFDHLSPEAPALEGVASYYFPDMSYDAYVYDYDREIWNLESDVIATNPEDVGERFYYALNQKSGKVEKNRMRGDWMNPTDADNPGNGAHKAVLPAPQEDAAELSSDQKLKKRFPIFRRRRNPESL